MSCIFIGSCVLVAQGEQDIFELDFFYLFLSSGVVSLSNTTI